MARALDVDLEPALAPVLGPGVRVEGVQRLSGGASRETWSFDAVDGDGTRHELVLRRDPPSRPSAPGAMELEARVLRAAHAAGLAVPAVLVDDGRGEHFGAAGLVMERMDGETIARRILRDPDYDQARHALTGQCAAFLARLHRIPPDQVRGLPAEDALTGSRLWYDQLGQPSATFELAFRWLDSHRLSGGQRDDAVVHGDFRLGNLMVGPDGLRAVLDWELVHQGDPVEDLGWLCTKAWRFGGSRPVGGFGRYDELIAAYEAAGGVAVDAEALRWWVVYGTLRWGVICMGQAATHLLGALRSVELAAIGRRVCEQEWDLLELIAPEAVAEVGSGSGEARSHASSTGASLHGRPTAGELLEAVREFLEGDVVGATDGRVRFHAQVAARAVAMVERELRLGPEQAGRYAAGLEQFGVADEAALASKVALAQLDDRRDELIWFLAHTVRDRLAVANPTRN